MNKDAYGLATKSQPYNHYWFPQHTWMVQTRKEPHLTTGTEAPKFTLPHTPEPTHWAATTNSVSCWTNHGPKAKHISMLTKLSHQDFYIYSDFFSVSFPKVLLLKRNSVFLSFKDKKRVFTQYKILYWTLWRTLKDN